MDLLTLNNDAAVLGISPDGPYSHRRFIRENGISYPLQTDDNKQVYKQFEMIEERKTAHSTNVESSCLIQTALSSTTGLLRITGTNGI